MYTNILLHHTKTFEADADNMRLYDINVNGMDDIRYNFIILNEPTSSKKSCIYLGRSLEDEPEVSGQTAEVSMLVCIVGDLNRDRPTDKQIYDLISLLCYVMKTYRLTIDDIEMGEYMVRLSIYEVRKKIIDRLKKPTNW
jgi:hypothetical protein